MSANVLARIDNQIGELSPESMRCQVLISLRNFRISWVELGKLLTDVAYGGDYKEWGYDDFEVYCASELGLKKPAVRKLMVCYNYMKSFEPGKLRIGTATLPEVETIALLQKARDRVDIEEDDKDEMHRMAFEEGADQQAVRKEIKARTRPKELFSDDEMEAANFNRGKEIKVIVKLGRSLRKKLYEARSVPEGIKDRVEEAICELEALE